MATELPAGQPLELSYEVSAYDTSVRTAWLDQRRGFFNGTSLLLRVHGQETQTHGLHISPSSEAPTWQLATGLLLWIPMPKALA